jgi:hypothetical protein
MFADIEIRQTLRTEYKKVGLEECFEYLKQVSLCISLFVVLRTARILQRFPDEANQVRVQLGVYLEEAIYDAEELIKRDEGRQHLFCLLVSSLLTLAVCAQARSISRIRRRLCWSCRSAAKVRYCSHQ